MAMEHVDDLAMNLGPAGRQVDSIDFHAEAIA
jgi:hypothetical protein